MRPRIGEGGLRGRVVRIAAGDGKGEVTKMDRRYRRWIVPWGALLSMVFAATPALGQEVAPAWDHRGDNVVYRGVSTAVKGDVSPPLREIVPLQAGRTKAEDEERTSNLMGPCGPQDPVDPVAQECLPAAEAVAVAPVPVASFDGFSNRCGGCTPPDPVGDVGPDHYVAMANSSFAVYSKTGQLLYGPADINTVWSGFGGPCQSENAGDPIVLYDQLADRWLMSQFTARGPKYYNCVCLSSTGDPTGTWQRYAFMTPIDTGANFPDYPKYGVWPDAYYISTREFGGGGFAGVGAYALNRAEMLAGSLTPRVISFLATPGGTPYYVGDGLLPADLDGSAPPPTGTPEFFLGTMDNGAGYGAPQDAINVFRFHVDWAAPSSSTFTRAATVPVAAFNSIFTPCGSGRACIPQKGTSNKVDILSYRQRPMHRAAYRNFGTHESIVTNQSVAGTSTVAGLRWYELRDPNGTPTIHQQGTYVPGATDGTHRWMGSVAMDKWGDMALGFSASSASVYPSVWYTSRRASDPPGEMPGGEGVVVNGASSQGSSDRWGDYSSMNVDPVDDCTFWYINQYYPASPSSSSTNWRLRIGAFRFPSCGMEVSPSAEPPSGYVPLTVSFTAQGTGGVAPFTYEWDFGDGATGSGETVNHTYTATGSFAATVTMKDSGGGSVEGETGVLVTVRPPVVSSVTKQGSPFRLKIAGDNFHSGCTVKVNGAAAPQTVFKSATLVQASGGSALKALVPKGQTVQITVTNNDDGGVSAPFSFSW